MISKPKPRNHELALVLKHDPTRLRDRTVLPERGKGGKKRPRRSNRRGRKCGEEES